MEYKPTEEQLQEWGKPIAEALYGFRKDDLEPLFERFILPIYAMCARKPCGQESKWKIVSRETKEDYQIETARERFIKLGLVNWG